MTAATSRTYTVAGMSCEHCVSSVREELAGVEGVDAVEVDLESGRLSISGSGIDEEAVRAAVKEAGYEVVS